VAQYAQRFAGAETSHDDVVDQDRWAPWTTSRVTGDTLP
jgi:hypothetical protein